LQLILLLPLIGAYLPYDVLLYIRGLNFSLFDFGIPFTIIDYSSFEFDQPDTYLYLIGLEYGSSMINILNITFTFLLVPILHLLLTPIYILTIWYIRNQGYFYRFIVKTFAGLTFDVYVRFICEIYLFLVLTATSELYFYERNENKYKSISWSVAVGVAAFCLTFFVIWIYQMIKLGNNVDLDKVYYFVEFFAGMRGTRHARTYAMLFITRRTLLCTWVVLFDEKHSLVFKILIFVIIQVWYLCYTCIVRAFAEFKDNFSEIVNEIVYTILCSSLFYYNTKDNWNPTVQWIYIGLIIFVNLLFWTVITSKCKHVIVIVHLTIQIVKYARNWSKKRRQQMEIDIQMEEQKEREKRDKKKEEQKQSVQVEQVPSGVKSQFEYEDVWLLLFKFIAIKCKFLYYQSYG
jgi:hypothetical protein